MTDLEMDLWEERSAIMEFDAGMGRFEAETKAAEAMGRKRWEFVNAQRKRNPERGGNNNSPVAGKQRQNAMPGMQRGPEKESGPVPQRDAEVGRAGVELLALRAQRWGVL